MMLAKNEGRRTSLENERAGKTIGNLTTSTRQPPGLVPSLASSPALSNASRLRALSPSHHILHSPLQYTTSIVGEVVGAPCFSRALGFGRMPFYE